MAVLLPSMSTIPHIQDHMTDAHGQSASSGLSKHTTNVATQPNSKRPKLSLQTTSLTNTHSPLTRGLVPNPGTQATFTPTTTNTLVNTWDLSFRPSPVSRTESPRPAPTRTQTPQQPYTLSLPFGLKSILKNSPLPPRQGSISASPRDSRKKVFFPPSKRVVFRRNLEDFIETTQYVARHVDLASSSEESSDEESQPDASSPGPPGVQASGSQCSPPPSRKRKNRRDSGIYIETNVEDAQTMPSEESASSTISSEVRKRRRWQFTLPPLGSLVDEAQTENEVVNTDTNEGDSSPEGPSETISMNGEGCSPLPSNQLSSTDGDGDGVSASHGGRRPEVSGSKMKPTKTEAQLVPEQS